MFGFISQEKNRVLYSCVIYSISIFCLLFPALYNGYAIVTPDSGAYIAGGWLLDVPIDRPLTYSIFIRITSLFGFSIWGVLVAQTLILVYYLRQVSRKILADKFSDKTFLFIVLLLTLFTTAGWVTSQLMPDIFTPILLLAIANYYLTSESTRWQKVISFLLIWVYIEQHNSNLLIMLLFTILVVFYSHFTKRKRMYKKTIQLLLLTLFSFISISFFNLWEGNSFRPSASSHVFIMSRMAENGILDEFLEEYCATEKYSICNYQGNLGDRQWDFMWNNNGGHLQNAGGWQNVEEEYNDIIFKTLIRPKYFGLHVYEAAEASVRQMTQFTLSFMIQGEGSSPYNSVEKYFPREIKEYRTSKQQSSELSGYQGFLNAIIVLFTGLLITLSILNYSPQRENLLSRNYNFLFMFIILTIILNAIVTATFSTVVDRLQARVFWLLPFTCLLFLIKTFSLTDYFKIKFKS